MTYDKAVLRCFLENQSRLFPEPVAETEEERPADVAWYVTDNRRTTDVFGWAPVRGARTILQDTHDWLRGHEDAFRSVFGG